MAEPQLRLARLSLTGFRSYDALTWRPQGRASVIVGPNGSGKTNLLEAISLLVPGRGLRGARAAELQRLGAPAWAVAARLDAPQAPLDIGTGSAPDGRGERRVFRVNGQPPRSQAEVASLVSAVWLTPQMDRLFQEAASGRRRFLDRLVYALEPAHAREVAAHDTAMAGRNRLLGEGRRDAAWLAGLEDAMARHAVAATVARMGLVARLNAVPPPGAFPAARMLLHCPIAARLAAEPALAVEDWLREGLAAGRPADAAAGGAALGAHRADMGLEDAATALPAALASTGQQKALLIGVVLAHAALLAEARGFAPLLLLDEPAVHLDAARREALFDALRRTPAQVFVTGTDREAFAPLAGEAEMLRTTGAGLEPG
jgi:DNA replication and repair protein RecF